MESNPVTPTTPSAPAASPADAAPGVPAAASAAAPAAQVFPTPEPYRPLSLWAVAGLCLGSLYCGLVVLTTLWALFKGGGFFLPGWCILIAIGGVAFSLLALREIAATEGTRAGGALARWGLWLSVVAGLSYTAFEAFTGLALKEQARRFLFELDDDDSGFLARLMAGTDQEAHRAFLLCLPPSRRNNYDPSRPEQIIKDFDAPGPKGEKGALTQFQTHALVQALRPAKGDAKIERIAKPTWEHEQGGYLVTCKYRIETPQQSFEVDLPVHSSDQDTGDGRRRWFVVMPKVTTSTPQLTALGEALKQLRDDSRGFALNALRGGAFAKLDQTDYDKLLPAPGERTIAKDLLGSLLKGDANLLKGIADVREAPAMWEIVDGRLRFSHDLDWKLPPPLPPLLTGRLRLVVQTAGVFDADAAGSRHWNPIRFEAVRLQVNLPKKEKGATGK
jgi:hypothetical protein